VTRRSRSRSTSLEDDVRGDQTLSIRRAAEGVTVVVPSEHSYAGAGPLPGPAGSEDCEVARVCRRCLRPTAGEPLASAGIDSLSHRSTRHSFRMPRVSFTSIAPKLHDVFCRDLSEADARIIAVTQKAPQQLGSSRRRWRAPRGAQNHRGSSSGTGRSRAINPDLLRFYAKRMGATTTEIRGSSHVSPFLSHPKEVRQNHRIGRQVAGRPIGRFQTHASKKRTRRSDARTVRRPRSPERSPRGRRIACRSPHG
jgi:hypothetical protein